MIVFRIISTVIMGIMCFVSFLLSCVFVDNYNSKHEIRNIIIATLISWAVLSFVIVTLWVL